MKTSKSRRMAGRADRSGRRIEQAELLNLDLLKRAIAWILNDDIFTNVAAHGNVSWKASRLVSLCLLWVWSPAPTLTGAFKEAKELSLSMFGEVAVNSYQALVKAAIAYGGQLIPILWLRLHHLMEFSCSSCWRIGDWVALAVDGTRVTTPRTKRNEAAFAAAKFGSSSKAKRRVKWKNKRKRSKPLCHPVKPQIWLTLIWHMGLKMPWAWRCGPSTASERHHLIEMLQNLVLPAKTLICADAGFIGYELWKQIADAGHSFVIRVGGNVRLLRNLGCARERAGLVYLWPDHAARKKQPPLILRLIKIQSPRGVVYLVTNVLSKQQLTDCQASRLYRLRWGIELQFRTFKQTFRRTKLRSRTPDTATAELEWSLLGLWVIELLAVKEQVAIDSVPERCSIALAIMVVRDTMRRARDVALSAQELEANLRAAVKDDYCRLSSKRARYRPQYKEAPSAGSPVIVDASKQQRENYAALDTLAA
jgi:hypothetical protein